MNNKTLIIIIVIIILAGGGFLLFRKNYTTTSQTTSSQNTQNSSNSTTSTQQSQNTVIYTSSGFSPASLIIKVGATVTWTNNSGINLSINSDPHPTHTNYPPLNIGAIENSQSQSLTFNKPWTYGYHNHLNPSDQGTITVQ